MTEERVERVGDTISQWVTFALDSETYGINVTQVQEVLPMPEITPVPGAPAWVMGVINLRGNVVTVIDTRVRLGISPKAVDMSNRVIVIETDEQVVGIHVDSVAEVVDICDSQIEIAPDVGSQAFAYCIHGIVNRNDTLLILLDNARLFAQQKWDQVAAL